MKLNPVEINPEFAEMLADMAPEEEHAFIIGLLMGAAQVLTDVQGTLDAHTTLLGKICREVGVSELEIRSAAKRVRDAG